ncbi:MAG: tetratricopeptide repeat protein [Syntrophorhabdaceae bacterium]|nr:tetratricopeptide repeat protein [Syntrophorhabdaceae bacterium]
MIKTRVVLSAVLVFLSFAGMACPEISVAAGPKKPPAKKVVLADESKKTVESARETALRHKELGDEFRNSDDVARAAQEYDKALSLYDGFPVEDRLMMTRFLSWGGKLDEAIRELNKILSKDPSILEARIQLASCLSWKGDQVASLEESSKALAASPENKDALLVRADALRRSDKQEESVSIYKNILGKEEDFDTRLALSQVYLSDGNPCEALKGAALLKPEYPYQEKEIANLRSDIYKVIRPDAVEGRSYDSDSDMARCLSWEKDQAAVAALAGESAKTAESAQETASRHKELGDEFRARDEVANAAREYDKALSLYDGFPKEDRLMMARYLSWGGKFDEAIRELNKILSEDPSNFGARIQLARCLSWKGDQEASLEESSKVLAASPDNKEALMARANALRLSGKQQGGISIYKDILEKGEDFDTRLGLSQVYLSDGYFRGARQGAALLKPEYPYQEKELDNLRTDIKKAARPDVGAGYGYYTDSDKNRIHRYNVYGGFWTGYLKWGVDYIYSDAANSTSGYNARSHRTTLSADTRPLEWLWVGGTAGYSSLEGNSSSKGFFVGGLRAGTRVYDGRLNVSASRNALTGIAELIAKQIRTTEIAANISYPLPYRFSVFAGYAYRDYSDDNRAMDMFGMIRHRFGLSKPGISMGYQLRYLDFQRQSRGGYFDPSNYMSHKLDVAIDYEIEKMYANLILYGGHQSFSRYGTSSNSFFGGWYAVLGRHVTDSIDIEIYSEGSSEKTGGSASGAGYRYSEVGARVRARF